MKLTNAQNANGYIYYILLVIFIIYLPMPGYSQGSIEGSIVGTQEKYVPFATVTLLRPSDSTLVKGTLSDTSGSFRFVNLSPNNYILYISHIQYKPYYRSVNVTSSKTVLPKVYLESSADNLDEVVVKGSRTLIERKIDRVIFNVEKSIMASTGDAHDVVAKSPGVRIDFQGNVTVNGKSARVLINNRPVNLSPEELSNYLKSIPAQNIQQAEVMSNPSSSYDASSGAIVNLVIRKNIQQGVFGSAALRYQQGQAGRTNAAGRLIYNRGRFRISNTYSYRNAHYIRDFLEENTFQTNNFETFWNTQSQQRANNRTHLYQMNMDYVLAPKHVVGIQFIGSYDQNTSLTETDNAAFSQQVLDSVINTNENIEEDRFRYSVNLNYAAKLGKSKLNIDLTYLDYVTDWKQNLDTRTTDLQGAQLLYNPESRNRLDRRIELSTATIDYIWPVHKKLTVKLGGKFNYITTDNDFKSENLLDEIYVNDPTRTNRFLYTEITQALYTSVDWKTGKHQLQFGLRGEATQTEGESVSLNETTVLDYMQLFPTIFWMFSPDDKKSISFSYRRGITRPGYWRVNPFRFYNTPLTYRVGNPRLRPMLEDALELAYTFANQISITGFFNYWKDEHNQVVVQDNANQTYHFEQINQDRGSVFGAYLNIPYQIKPWWEINAYLQVSQTTASSNYLNTSYDNSQVSFYGSLNNSFVLSKKGKLTAEITGWYASPDASAFYRVRSIFDISFGIRKRFAKKWSVAISVSDLLYTQPTRLQSVQDNLSYSLENRQDTQTIRLSIGYRFLKGKVKQPRRRNTGNSDERNRIK
ncbi:MAG TPA: hypothetical protein DCS93_13520 [Microscillaceae bacterium]|nr:hypothetical protein [Microscillaceae bacterium]